MSRAKFAGASVDVMALASLRATNEAMTTQDGEELPVIVGTPIGGEVIGGEKFNGETQTAIFPGDLPDDPHTLFDTQNSKDYPELAFVRFRPPQLKSKQITYRSQPPPYSPRQSFAVFVGRSVGLKS